MSGIPEKTAEVPSHVPADLVFDFDFYEDPIRAEEFHVWIASILANAPPIFFTPRNGGHWVVARYDALFRASQQTALFSSRQTVIPGDPTEQPLIPINLDPPMHGSYRAVLARPFSPKAIAQLEDGIRALTDELIDRVIDHGHCEFITSIAEPLPAISFMKMMGLPPDRLAEFRAWVTDFLGHPEQRLTARNALNAAIVDLVQERQKERRDDLIGLILEAQIDGRPPTMDEIQGFCQLAVLAGIDSVGNAMAFGVCQLARDQELQARLRAEPTLIPNAVEELLRRDSIGNPAREVACDLEFDGVKMRKGERVLFLLAAGDLDSAAYADPQKVDLERRNKAHMAFGIGPHRCLGSHLARVELRILYEEWLRRVLPFRLAGRVRYRGGHVFGINELHIEWRR